MCVFLTVVTFKVVVVWEDFMSGPQAIPPDALAVPLCVYGPAQPIIYVMLRTLGEAAAAVVEAVV
jgi:hypothetical protein